MLFRSHWDGGLNNFIGMTGALSATQRNEYFESIGEEYSEATYYEDLASWAMLGEDTYPTVTDTKGALTGGELMNGTSDDFVVIETP